MIVTGESRFDEFGYNRGGLDGGWRVLEGGFGSPSIYTGTGIVNSGGGEGVYPRATFGRSTVHGVLDAVGVFDPFGIADGINAIAYLIEGDYVNSAISAVSILPFGDVAKAGKYGTLAANATVRAESSLSGQLLRNQLAGQEIAGGHAFTKHAGEFGFTTPGQMASHVENVMTNPSSIRNLTNGWTAYWDNATQSAVIRNPTAVDGGTVFRPTNGITYFNNLR